MQRFYVAVLVVLASVIGNSVPASERKADRQKFYSLCERKFPKYLFKGEQRQAFEEIFDYWEGSKYRDPRWLAYILATAYRESAGTMQPVREGLCDTDECSIKKVTAHFKTKKISTNYAIPDKYGRSYFGRGLVQITHKRNYERVGKALGWGDEFVTHPELALDRKKAIVILVEGSARGLFSKDKASGNSHKLGSYFNDNTTDWVSARKIINPRSKRAPITAGYGKTFYSCLSN